MIETNPRKIFLELLEIYFGDQSLQVGLGEIVSISARVEDFHREVLSAIDSSIEAAAEGDLTVLNAVRDRFLRDRRDDNAVVEFLKEIRSEYLRLRAQLLAADGT